MEENSSISLDKLDAIVNSNYVGNSPTSSACTI